MSLELVIASAASLSLALDVYVLFRERQDRKRLVRDEARLAADEAKLRETQCFPRGPSPDYVIYDEAHEFTSSDTAAFARNWPRLNNWVDDQRERGGYSAGERPVSDLPSPPASVSVPPFTPDTSLIGYIEHGQIKPDRHGT